MSDKRLLIFDFDGTLADTFPGIVSALNAARARLGYPEVDRETIRRWIGYGLRHFMEHAVPEEVRDGPAVDEMTRSYKAIYREMAFDSARLFEGVSDVLDAVANDSLVVVSNKSADQLEPMVERLGIRDRFLLVIGGDSLAKPKPHRLVYDHVADALNARELSGWVIGDSEPDIELGRNAGLQTVACLWGLRTRAELERVGATHVVEDRAQLRDVLTRPPVRPR